MGFAPMMTSCLLDRRSNQLSYGALYYITTCSIVFYFFQNILLIVQSWLHIHFYAW